MSNSVNVNQVNSQVQNPQLGKILKSWSLVAFRNEFGQMKIGDFVNKETGETFKSCIFTKGDNEMTFVNFSSKLGVLTAQQIKSQVPDLQVVKKENGKFTLCKKGDSSWEDVDF